MIETGALEGEDEVPFMVPSVGADLSVTMSLEKRGGEDSRRELKRRRGRERYTLSWATRSRDGMDSDQCVGMVC